MVLKVVKVLKCSTILFSAIEVGSHEKEKLEIKKQNSFNFFRITFILGELHELPGVSLQLRQKMSGKNYWHACLWLIFY